MQRLQCYYYLDEPCHQNILKSYSRKDKKLQAQIGENQFGFRKGMVTCDGLFIRVIIILQRCRDVNYDICASVVDYEKAIHKVRHDKLMYILENSNPNDENSCIIVICTGIRLQQLEWNIRIRSK